MSEKPLSGDNAFRIIRNLIADVDDHWPDWYVGVTSNWKERLFKQHNVPGKGDEAIFLECGSENDARAAERSLLALGCDGDEGGGDESSVYVYAYRKRPGTNP